MPSSSTHFSSQFNRKPKNLSASFSEEQSRNAAKTNCNSTHMRPQEEPKKVPNGSFARRERGVRYKECRKNHAATIGGYAVDGCREFMASGEEGTSAALKCAACSCHRNFHKKEVEDDWPSDSWDSTSRK